MIQLTREQIENIAAEVELGMDCYVHIETGETISIPNEGNYDLEGEPFQDELRKIKNNRKSYLLFEPMDSHDSFNIMSDFCYEVDDENFRDRLLTALERPKPFANFKFDLDSRPDYREKWYKYKHDAYVNYVKLMLETDSEEDIIQEDEDTDSEEEIN